MAKLSLRQRKKITNLFSFNCEDWELIRKYKYNWDHKKLQDLRTRVNTHYSNEQNKLCAYCKLPFRDDIQVEHIVPKKGKFGRKEFTFLPENLAVACKHCNTKKSTNNDMIPFDREEYPRIGLYFKIIHPHFDDYFEHIEIVDKSRYVHKTVKGYKTIKRCGLFEERILSVLVRYMRYEDNSLIEGVLRIQDLKDNFQSKIDRFINKIFSKREQQ